MPRLDSTVGGAATPTTDITAAPRWARIADWTTAALLVLAALVFLFGGFREQIGPIRISVRSWARIVLWATVLTGIRHWLVRAPTIRTVVGSVLQRFWASEARQAVWPALVGTRAGVLVAGYFAVVTFGFAPGSVRFRVWNDELRNLPARWDAGWYLEIARDGYEWDGNPKRQQSVVFFPALPIAMRIAAPLFGRDWLLAGTVLAVTAFFFGLIYLYRLARDLLDADSTRTAIWALAAYPFSVYYSAPYTEGFFLLASAGAFYHATRNQWGRAAAWGYFIALCRPNGCFIALPIGLFALQHALRERRLTLAPAAAVLTPLAGVLTYSAFLHLQFGDALAWTKGQLAWGRAFVGLWPGIQALIVDRYDFISRKGLYQYTVSNPYDAMHTAAAIFVLVSIWPTIRRFGWPYGAFTAVNILPPLIVGGMMSIGRMTSVLFPAFLWLGAVLPRRYAPAWIAASLVLQGLLAALFYSWRPAF